MASMLDNLRELVTPAILFHATGQTGEPESAIVKGFAVAIPAIAATIASRSDDHGFMKQLADLALGTSGDPDPLGRSGVLSASASDYDTTSTTGGWLSGLFGRNLFAATDSIARYAGIRGSSASTLLSMAAPLVLGYIGRMMRSDRLTADSLADRLRIERPQLAAALPAGFDLPGIVRAPHEAVRTPMNDASRRTATVVQGEQASERWGFPMMLLLTALGIGGLIWWTSREPVQQQARVSMDQAVPNAVGTSGTLKPSLPGNIHLILPTGSAEDRLSMYLGSAANGDATIKLDRIAFDTNSASLTPQSREQLDNIASILIAYPMATVIVAGHTDNMGNEEANVALSRARAEAVAGKLTGAGVAANRVQAEGFGSRNPVANNSTEAGRAENRRVELEVNGKGVAR